jgi:hypothetical protein
MSNFILNGINLTTGKDGQVTNSDTTTNSSKRAIGAALGLIGFSPPGIDSGITGLQGVTGLEGFQGITGLRGPTGFQGLTGNFLRGETGFSGVTGLFGRTGIKGVTGLRGVTGSQGYASYLLVTGAMTISATSEIIGVDTNTAYTLTLPSATGMSRSKTFLFQDETGTADVNNILINTQFFGGGPAGGVYNTINRTTGIRIDAPFMAVEIYSNGNRYLARVFKAGNTGIQGMTGIQGITGLQGITGSQGETGVS